MKIKLGEFFASKKNNTLYILTELSGDDCIYKPVSGAGSAYISTMQTIQDKDNFYKVKPEKVYLYVRKAKMSGSKQLDSVKSMRTAVAKTLGKL